jgi:hypothetical protein
MAVKSIDAKHLPLGIEVQSRKIVWKGGANLGREFQNARFGQFGKQ